MNKLGLIALSLPIILNLAVNVNASEVSSTDQPSVDTYVKDGIVYSESGVPIGNYDKNVEWIVSQVESFKVDYSNTSSTFWRDSTLAYGQTVNGFKGMSYNYDVCAMNDFFIRVTDDNNQFIDNIFAFETCFIISKDEYDYWKEIKIGDEYLIVNGVPNEKVTSYFDRYDAVSNPNGTNNEVIEFPVYMEFDSETGKIVSLNSKYNITKIDQFGLRASSTNFYVNLFNLISFFNSSEMEASAFFGHIMTIEDYEKNYVGHDAWLSNKYLACIPNRFDYNYTTSKYLKEKYNAKDCNYVWRIPYPKLSRIKYINCWFKKKKEVIKEDGTISKVEEVIGGAFNKEGIHQVWEGDKFLGMYDKNGNYREEYTVDKSTGLVIDKVTEKPIEDYDKNQPQTSVEPEVTAAKYKGLFDRIKDVLYWAGIVVTIIISLGLIVLIYKFILKPLYNVLFKKK